MSIKLNIHVQLLHRYFQKNQCLNIKKYAAHSLQRLAQGPCVQMTLSLLIHFQHICISTYIWFNVMYLILFSLCVYARLYKLEERGNEIQRYMQLYTKFVFPFNNSKIIFISVLQTYKQNNVKAVSCNLHGRLNQQNKL